VKMLLRVDGQILADVSEGLCTLVFRVKQCKKTLKKCTRFSRNFGKSLLVDTKLFLGRFMSSVKSLYEPQIKAATCHSVTVEGSLLTGGDK